MKLLNVLIGVLILLLVLAACGQQSAPTDVATNLSLSIRVEPEQLSVGETTLIVTLKDANGRRIDGANLQIHADMDHEGMSPVDREVNESSNGEYRVPFEWSMGGGWVVKVSARLASASEISETFNFFVEAVSNESIVNRNNSAENATVNIHYQVDKTPTIIADAIATVTITDMSGSPITDAVVKVTGDMAHQGMMPISGKGEHTKNGRYDVLLRWTMAGNWIMTVNVMLADGRQFEQIFDQAVEMS